MIINEEALTNAEVSNSDPSTSVQSQVENEEDEWEQLSNRYMEIMKISSTKMLTKSQLQRIQRNV